MAGAEDYSQSGSWRIGDLEMGSWVLFFNMGNHWAMKMSRLIKNRLKIVGVIVFWILLNLFTSKGDLASDQLFEIGYPFTFYTDFNGKHEPGNLKLGFDFVGLSLDILIVSTVVLLLYKYQKFIRE